MCAKTTWPLSSLTENVVLGKTCSMLPKTSSGASLTLCGFLALGGCESALRRRLRIAMDGLLYNMKCNPLHLGLLLDGSESVKCEPIFRKMAQLYRPVERSRYE